MLGLVVQVNISNCGEAAAVANPAQSLLVQVGRRAGGGGGGGEEEEDEEEEEKEEEDEEDGEEEEEEVDELCMEKCSNDDEEYSKKREKSWHIAGAAAGARRGEVAEAQKGKGSGEREGKVLWPEEEEEATPANCQTRRGAVDWNRCAHQERNSENKVKN
ncbi:hypothetical protein FOCC_FOCC007760 [Frankliniella occidentalis]|nr:hypothetical protein FOCC_FOCC007760 [Frankliniella occidentalis]